MFALLSLLMLATPTAALEPVGPWRVNYAKASCLLERDFGEGKSRITLAFSATVLDESASRLFVAAQDGQSVPSSPGTAFISFNAEPATTKARFEVTSSADGTGKILKFTLPKEFGALAAVQTTTIQFEKREPQTFVTSGMPGAAKALKACVDDLSRSFGIDPDEEAKAVTPAKTDNGFEEFVKPSDYPLDLAGSGIEGTSVFVFSIGIDGRASDCRILESSGNLRLDQISCAAILTRARYRPALDRDGKPMVTHWKRATKWVIH